MSELAAVPIDCNPPIFGTEEQILYVKRERRIPVDAGQILGEQLHERGLAFIDRVVHKSGKIGQLWKQVETVGTLDERNPQIVSARVRQDNIGLQRAAPSIDGNVILVCNRSSHGHID